MNLTTLATRATTAVVAGVAGFSSYRHIVEVAQRAGEHQAVAAVLPLSIDGLILVGTMAMVEDKRAGRRPRLSARVALGFGVVATLAANIASAQPNLMARLVAAVPAVAFLITVEVLARTGRIRAVELSTDMPAEVSPPVSAPPAASDLPKPIFDYAEPIGPVPTPMEVAVDKLSAAKPTPRKRPPSSRDRVVAAHNRTPKASDATLAARLDVSEATVKRHRPAKAVDNVSPEKAVNGEVPQLEDSPV